MFEPNSALDPFFEPDITFHVSHWPTTWGWILLLVVGLVWVGTKLRKVAMKWWRNRYRREALGRLQTIARLPSKDAFLAAHELLKIVSVHVYGREVVATLSDADWYALLNSSLHTPAFDRELEFVAHDTLYRNKEVARERSSAYLSAVGDWLRLHSLEQSDA